MKVLCKLYFTNILFLLYSFYRMHKNLCIYVFMRLDRRNHLRRASHTLRSYLIHEQY